jgi:uncharacterized phage-associated protein
MDGKEVPTDSVNCVAAYLSQQYFKKHHMFPDEMKLHKLMYFAQRESYVQNDTPLFDAVFYGWKYGPVLKEIRTAYSLGDNFLTGPVCVSDETQNILDRVLDEYAEKDSWSLSRLTHGELSWKNSRTGVPEEANSDNPMKNSDIQLDAQRIKNRRKIISTFGFN